MLYISDDGLLLTGDCMCLVYHLYYKKREKKQRHYVTYQLLLGHMQKHWHFVQSVCVVEWASLMKEKPLVESSAHHGKHQS